MNFSPTVRYRSENGVELAICKTMFAGNKYALAVEVRKNPKQAADKLRIAIGNSIRVAQRNRLRKTRFFHRVR